jgi:hypothetical protein
MAYDPIQCTRAYLTLWKLVDRLFPGSSWLEIGPIPNEELQINAKELLDSSNLIWCDEPARLSEYASNVLALRRHRLEQGAIANADRLRSELMDQAMRYAKQIEPTTSEWSSNFPWTLLKSKSPLNPPFT